MSKYKYSIALAIWLITVLIVAGAIWPNVWIVCAKVTGILAVTAITAGLIVYAIEEWS